MSQPRILLYDLEVSPNKGYTWGKWDQNVLHFERQNILMSVAYKWLGDKDVTVTQLCDFEDYNPDDEDSRWDDESLTHELFELLDEADVVVGHNVKKYDNKVAQARMLYWNTGTPRPYKSVDTLTICRQNFRLNSNRLGDVGEFLGVGGKRDTDGLDTWMNCLQGDPVAWETMRNYAEGDVVLLEKIFLRLRPYVTGFNFGLYNPDGDEPVCPVCGSASSFKNGRRYAMTYAYQQYTCRDCGKHYRGSKMLNKTEVQ